jgi:hypothetical protein
MITQEEVMEAIKIHEELYKQVEGIAEDYIKIKDGREIDTIDGIIIDEYGIEVTGRNYSRCGCCSDEYESYDIPISYLWDPDWQQDLRKELNKRNLEALKKKAEEKKEQERKAKEAEYKRFLELKEKFDEE